MQTRRYGCIYWTADATRHWQASHPHACIVLRTSSTNSRKTLHVLDCTSLRMTFSHFQTCLMDRDDRVEHRRFSSLIRILGLRSCPYAHLSETDRAQSRDNAGNAFAQLRDGLRLRMCVVLTFSALSHAFIGDHPGSHVVPTCVPLRSIVGMSLELHHFNTGIRS